MYGRTLRDFVKDLASLPGQKLFDKMAASAETPDKFDAAVKTLGLKTFTADVTEGQPLVHEGNPIPSVSAWAFGGTKRGESSDLFDDDMLNQLFGGRGRNMIPEQRASGSGVIISNDGYIVTNNHVVENADEIDVTLSNKKTYKAKVIGTDPSYDLSVIKIEAAGLLF